jgi:hypothetical protein
MVSTQKYIQVDTWTVGKGKVLPLQQFGEGGWNEIPM